MALRDVLLVEIEVFGDRQISRKIMRFSARALRSVPLWNSLYQDLLNIENIQFLTEGQHGSGGWVPLSETTVREKAYRGQMPWILRATEALFKSLTRRSAPGNIREIEPTWMRFGSSIPYGVHHQFGTVKMPMRKPMDFTETEKVLIVKKVQRFITTGEIVPIL